MLKDQENQDLFMINKKNLSLIKKMNGIKKLKKKKIWTLYEIYFFFFFKKRKNFYFVL